MATDTAKRRVTKTTAKRLCGPIGPQVYSYGRFSTPEQEQGTSERRQSDNSARQYAKRIGLPYNESLRMFDRGESAFRGDHLAQGFLGKFFELIKSGDVASGSVLVIEDIDRLSRQEPLDHIELIITLAKHGISIHTPSDDTTYSKESINSHLFGKLLGKIQNAHETSLNKSRRGKENWKFKREDARQKNIIATERIPEWLMIVGRVKRNNRVVSHGEFKVIRDAAKSIIMAFRRFDRGGVGVTTLTRYLNAKAPWSPPPRKKKSGKPGEMTTGGWHKSYVGKLLGMRSLIGEHQHHTKPNGKRGKRVPDGEPMPNYYPNLFKKYSGLFESVQQKRKPAKGKQNGGRNGKATNLLQKLVTCAYCGGPMHFENKGDGCTYLKCYNGQQGVACRTESPYSVRYDEFETLVLTNCPRIKPVNVMPNKDEETKLCRALQQRVQRLAARIDETKQFITNLNDSLERENDPQQRDELSRRIRDRRTEKVELDEQLASENAELQKAEHGLNSFVNWQADFTNLLARVHEKKKDEDGGIRFANIDLRHRLNGHLKEFIDRIEIYAEGHKSIADDTFEEEMVGRIGDQDDTFPTESDRDFINFVIARRKGKNGRFARVQWKNGSYVDLVPNGSQASGNRLVPCPNCPPSIMIVSPDLKPLLKEFAAKKPKPR